MTRFDSTWVGYAVVPQPPKTAPRSARASRPFAAVSLGSDMVEQLRRRLRQAEAEERAAAAEPPQAVADEDAGALESSGVRPCAWLDEAPFQRRLDAIVSAVPELEAALAPNSESNFYGGFDDGHPAGVFVATHRALAVGSPVNVTVHLPGGSRFEAAALVEWARPVEAASAELPPGLGLSFCRLDGEARRLVRAFVRQREPLFYLP